jgi:hypothetical protein
MGAKHSSLVKFIAFDYEILGGLEIVGRLI